MDGAVQKERICRESPHPLRCAPTDLTTDLSSPPDALRILLLEDHLDTAAALTCLLRFLGYDVSHAPDVATALQIAAREPFDLIISDIVLPDGSGLDFMRQLPGAIGGRRVRGIALSGYGFDDLESTRAVGFAEHLVKPVNIDQLHAAIRRVASTPE
jgi:CheY-like chemotaxis protein